jgi:hypothetical protein
MMTRCDDGDGDDGGGGGAGAGGGFAGVEPGLFGTIKDDGAGAIRFETAGEIGLGAAGISGEPVGAGEVDFVNKPILHSFDHG